MLDANDDLAQGGFKRLVVFGDSNVRGGEWLTREDERWADILWRLLERAQGQTIHYYNAGLGATVISPRSPGYEASTRPSATERLAEEVVARNPDLLVVAYGLNDMRSGMEPRAFCEDMAWIVETVRRSLDATIALANVYRVRSFRLYPPFDRGSLQATIQYNDVLKDLADRMDCIYADIWGAQGQKDHVIDDDTVHSNRLGNMLVAHKVFEAIVHAIPELAVSSRVCDVDAVV